MKKVLVFLSLLLISTNVLAVDIERSTEEEIITEVEIEKEEVTNDAYLPGEYEVSLVNCVNKEEMWVNYKGKKTRIKLLAFDSSNSELDNEIKKYVCELLTNGQNLKIEIDENKAYLDEYNRLNVWLYVDGELLQKKLIENGYGQVNHITGDYKYIDELCNTQYNAIVGKLGIWNYSDIKEEYCDSNVKIAKNEEKIKEKKENDSKKTTKLLRYLVYLSSGIIILLIALRKDVYEKKR